MGPTSFNVKVKVITIFFLLKTMSLCTIDIFGNFSHSSSMSLLHSTNQSVGWIINDYFYSGKFYQLPDLHMFKDHIDLHTSVKGWMLIIKCVWLGIPEVH